MWVSRRIERRYCAKRAAAMRKSARLKSGLEKDAALRMRRRHGNALRRCSGETSGEKKEKAVERSHP